MQAKVKLTCPYCGHGQPAVIDMADFQPYTRPQVVVCDSEEGGCDKWYVFEARATFTVTTGTIGGDLQPAEQPEPEAPAIVKPDWNKAPKWANYWAVSGTGCARWFEFMPKCGLSNWVYEMGYTAPAGVVNLDGGHWYRTLAQRPQAVQP